jgi:DNA polymerase-3 subunit delta'
LNRFDIIKGQAKAWSILARAHAAGKVASTYLISGPEGCGAWSLVVEFAALLNCEAVREVSIDEGLRRPCGECRSCRGIIGLNFEGFQPVVPIGTHKNIDEAVDLTNETLEAKRSEPFKLLDRTKPIHIPIELAREVKRRLATRADQGVRRVVFFYRMDDMQWSSADALLKMIEEPPPDTVIVMTAVRPEEVPPTILSRSQKIRLTPLPESMVVEYLMSKYDANESTALLAARVSQRSLGRAIAALPSDDSDETNPRGVGLLLFKSLLTESSVDVAARMGDMLDFQDRGAAQRLVVLWQSLIRDCAYYANVSDATELVNVDFIPEIRQYALRLGDQTVVQRMVEVTKITLADLELNVHIQPALVAMALKLKAAMETDGGNVAS